MQGGRLFRPHRARTHGTGGDGTLTSRQNTYARTMNYLEVRPVDVVIEHLSCPPIPSVDLYVDGRRLLELVLPAETAGRRSLGNPEEPNEYLPMAVHHVRGPEHYLGSPVEYWANPGETALLGCSCGEWDCSPLTATVSVTRTHVSWSTFRTATRGWGPLPLGPFRFDRARYEAAFTSIDWRSAHGG